MSGIYYAELLDVLRVAGCRVAENEITDGWESRARSSGGFPEPPLAVFWHHTASSTSPENDLAWMINGSDDAPIGNLLLDRSGTFWPIAAGASNCAGQGGPATFSRGTIPADSGNTRGFQLEVANAGTGEPWPAIQIDAYFAGSNALNAHVGNRPDDLITHALGDGDGWTDRKVDPAIAGAVEGPWRPSSASSSGTWRLADIRAEARARAGAGPPPEPPEEVIVSGSSSLWMGGGRLDNFMTDDRGAVWHNWYEPGRGWTAMENLEGVLDGPVSATGEGRDGTPVRIDLTGKGVDDPPGLWHRWYVDGKWSRWERVADWP